MKKSFRTINNKEIMPSSSAHYSDHYKRWIVMDNPQAKSKAIDNPKLVLYVLLFECISISIMVTKLIKYIKINYLSSNSFLCLTDYLKLHNIYDLPHCWFRRSDVQERREDSSSSVANPKPCHLTLPKLSSRNTYLWS